MYGKEVNNVWTQTEGSSRRYDKVLIKLPSILRSKFLSKYIDNTGVDNGMVNNVQKNKRFPRIHLTDNEKFADSDNNIHQVEIRETRKYDNIYFKIKDIAKCFNIKKLCDHTSDKNSTYKEHVDYIHIDTSKYKNVLFFTYKGLLRSLFVSRSKETSKFVDWCMKTLFAAQFGTEKQKDKLVSTMKGISYDIIHDLFSRNARSMPCIYLVALNKVGTLRESMNIDRSIDDNSIVYKFGLSKTFESRTYNHKSEFKELGDKIDLNLVLYTYIDPIYCFDAGKTLAKFVSNKKINYKNFAELVVINDSEMDNIKMFFENIGNRYSGHTTEFNSQITSLNNIITRLQGDINNKIKDLDNITKIHRLEMDLVTKTHEIELEKTKVELEKNKAELEKTKVELEKKDIIISKNNEIHQAQLESLKYQLKYKDLVIQQANTK